MPKSILVTGGAGFIGSHFVKHIFRNYPGCRVTVLDYLTYAGNIENIPDNIKGDSRFSFWYGNIRNGDLVNDLMRNVDTVVHFAAESHVARSIYDNTIFFETDVLGTQVLANSALKHSGNIERFIHISTSEVYGTALTSPMSEDHPLNPTTPYAAAKAGADRLIYSYGVTYNLPVVIIRPFNAYGANQHLEKVIPRFITGAIMDEPLVVHGSGENTRDWNYVDDICRAVDKVVHASINDVKGQVFNIGTGRDISVKMIADMILTQLGKPRSLVAYMEDRPGQVQRHIADAAKATKILDWRPEVDFGTGLAKTIVWYQNNPDWWKKLLWMRSVPTRTVDGKVVYH
jgi:dTDP-glucose 4,6-dehydratase